VEAFPPDLALMNRDHDARWSSATRLVWAPMHPPFAVLDLGEEWVAMTGLPMGLRRVGLPGPGVAAELAPASPLLPRRRERLEEIDSPEGRPASFSEALASST